MKARSAALKSALATFLATFLSTSLVTAGTSATLILTHSPRAEARFQMTKASSSKRKIQKVSIHDIQTLDSQIQALNAPLAASLELSHANQNVLVSSASSQAGSAKPKAETFACGYSAKARDALLIEKRHNLDLKIQDFVAPKIHAQGSLSIADSTWTETCALDCHCAIYKQILEVAGSERLSESDRRIYQTLTELAMNQPLEERNRCAARGLSALCK